MTESRRLSFDAAYNTHWRDDKYMHKFNWKFGKEEPLGLPKLKWEGNFKINLKSVGCNGVEWIYLAEDTDEWRFLVNGYELRISIKCR